MTREMTSAQITEWEAFYRLEPFTADRIEYMMSYFMAIYANVNRPKSRKAFTPDKFLMFLGQNRQAEDQDAARERTQFERFFSRVKDGGN